MTRTIIDKISVGDPADSATAIIFRDDRTCTYGFYYHQNGGDGDDVTGFDSEDAAREAAVESPYSDH